MISNECFILMVGRSLTSTVSATTSSSTRCDCELVGGTCGCMLLVMSNMMATEIHFRLSVCVLVGQKISIERFMLMVGRSFTSTVSATTSSSTRCDCELVGGTCGCMLLVMSSVMTTEMHFRLSGVFGGLNDIK